MFEKMKDMTFKQKLGYFWEYYRGYVYGAILLIVFIAYLINTIFINPPRKTYASIALLGTPMASASISGLGDEMTKAVVEDPKKFEVVPLNFFNTQDVLTNDAGSQKFWALVAAHEIDLIVCNVPTFENLQTGNGAFLDLSTVLSSEYLAENKDKLKIMKASDGSSKDIPYAIDVTGNKFLKQFNFPSEKFCIGIVKNSVREEQTLKLLKYFLK